jgi:large subunit ribosomal protein L21
MFAVIKISGKQYAVTPGVDIEVDHIAGNEGDVVEMTDVLLRDSGKSVDVGAPFVKGATVKATIAKQFQGEKINVRRYKSKVRHRRSIGFRAQLTKLHIDEIV